MPDELVSSITPSRVAMLGTDCKPVRCTALEGEVGKGTSCSIYAQRSSTCREFEASWTDGQHNPDCDAARAAFGLAPVMPRQPPNTLAYAVFLDTDHEPERVGLDAHEQTREATAHPAQASQAVNSVPISEAAISVGFSATGPV